MRAGEADTRTRSHTRRHAFREGSVRHGRACAASSSAGSGAPPTVRPPGPSPSCAAGCGSHVASAQRRCARQATQSLGSCRKIARQPSAAARMSPAASCAPGPQASLAARAAASTCAEPGQGGPIAARRLAPSGSAGTGRTLSSARRRSGSPSSKTAAPSGPASTASAAACSPRACASARGRPAACLGSSSRRGGCTPSPRPRASAAQRPAAGGGGRGARLQDVHVQQQLLAAALVGRTRQLLRGQAASQLQQLVAAEAARAVACAAVGMAFTTQGCHAPDARATQQSGCSPALSPARPVARACRTRLVTTHHRQHFESGPPARCSRSATCCCFA